MTVRSPSRQDTRIALLDAAEDLFAEHGFEAVGVREIVEHAGANIASVAYHFGGKAVLYREVVRRAAERKGTEDTWAVLKSPPADAREAAKRLVRFIDGFMQHLLLNEASECLCGLIVHEAAEPTDAMSFIVDDFMKPHEDRLKQTIAVLAPQTDQQTLSRMAQSVLGQMLHYRMYRPFIERLSRCNLKDATQVREVARHIARVSLLGFGCTKTLAEEALTVCD